MESRGQTEQASESSAGRREGGGNEIPVVCGVSCGTVGDGGGGRPRWGSFEPQFASLGVLALEHDVLRVD